MTLEEVRIFLGLSQSEISRRLGMDRKSFHRTEKNESLSRVQYMALSRIFGDEIISQIEKEKS